MAKKELRVVGCKHRRRKEIRDIRYRDIRIGEPIPIDQLPEEA